MSIYGGYGYGYPGMYGGYGMYPGATGVGFQPVQVGPQTSTPLTGTERLGGELYHEQGENSGLKWGTLGGGLGGAALGAGVGVWFGGPVGAAIGAAVGGVVGVISGLFAGEAIGGAKATYDDARDNGKLDGNTQNFVGSGMYGYHG